MKVRRSRVLSTDAESAWRVVGDPHHLPRWWPRAQRVEAVTPSAWTVVLGSDRGRSVRADYTLALDEPPERRAWTLEVEGTPFEKILSEQLTTVVLAPAGAGQTRVTLEVQQRGRRWARLGGVMLRAATRRNLDEALDGLASALEPA